MLFEDAEFELWGNRALVHAPFGGAEFGECLATAAAIEEGDRDSWKREWTRTGERVRVGKDEQRRRAFGQRFRRLPARF